MRARVARFAALLVALLCLGAVADGRAVAVGVIAVLAFAELLGAVADSPLG